MALTNTCVRFLIWAKNQGTSFDHTLTLGHLDNKTSRETVIELAEKNPGTFDLQKIDWENKYADSLISSLGAKQVLSLDRSDFEKADLLFDLNHPLPATMNQRYSAVIDGGTLEHVFDFPQAIRSCMQVLRPGGHFIGFSPANNLMGHGFYQFSPELMYRVFSDENGFKVKGIYLVAADFSVDTGIWFEVPDPATLNDRVELTNSNPAYMMVLAEKTHTAELKTPVYQSDYIHAWENIERSSIPGPIRKGSVLTRLMKRLFNKKKAEEDLEQINPLFFRKRNF